MAGIAVGLWWADAVAAMVISWSILHDGMKNVRIVVSDLMDKTPTGVDADALDPLRARVETELRTRSWVKDARVRLREEGHVYFGEAFVIPSDHRGLVGKIERAAEDLHALDWRLLDVVIVPVGGFDERSGMGRASRQQ